MRIPSANPYLLTDPEFNIWVEGYTARKNDFNPHQEENLKLAWRQGKEARFKDIEVIPEGMYCYSYGGDNPGTCPYWYFLIAEDGSTVGACSFLNLNDGTDPMALLFDHIKACGENDDWEWDEL